MSSISVGERFGRLVVVELIPHRKSPMARCVCDCGGEVTPQRSNLRKGGTKSCGCIKAEMEEVWGTLPADPRTPTQRNIAKAQQAWRYPVEPGPLVWSPGVRCCFVLERAA